MWLILFAGILIVVICKKIIKPLQYWKNKKIPSTKPWPLFGNMTPFILKRQAFPCLMQDLYNIYPNKRYLGFYHFTTPILMLRCPKMIKEICIKNFNSFADRQQFLPEGADPFWDKNLLALSGEKWKSMRGILSPTFTSSKMQAMFDLVKDSAKHFTQHFLEKDNTVILEMKDTFTRFTNDVTANTIFGVTCDSLDNGDNKFYLAVKRASNFGGGLKKLKVYAYTFCPKLMKLLNITFFEEEVKHFFCEIITETIKFRKSHDIVRLDMIHLLMEAKQEQLKKKGSKRLPKSETGNEPDSEDLNYVEITDEDITAQALIFFLGGFDTSSTLMSFMAYELAINPDIQRKLIQEIDKTLNIEDGDVSYSSLMSMCYLDMIVQETLRKWPPSALTSRVVTKPFTIEPSEPNESKVYLEPGTVCWIPIYAIHRDQKYFAHPERFAPERFREHRKSEINPSTFLPFGVGPRNCIGSRFALLKAKTIIFHILSKFEIIPMEKTEIPLTFSKSGTNMMSANGIWLGLKPRETRNFSSS